MSTKKQMSWLAVVCLIVGVGAGAAGAQVIEATFRVRFVNSGLFSLRGDDRAQFHVTLDDTRAGAPGTVLLQFLDEQGTVVARRETVLQAGQSTSLRVAGPGRFRAHARLMDSTFDVTSRRTVVGSVEVLNLTTEERDPVCALDEWGPGGGRQ
jgi:hypothetical protein